MSVLSQLCVEREVSWGRRQEGCWRVNSVRWALLTVFLEANHIPLSAGTHSKILSLLSPVAVLSQDTQFHLEKYFLKVPVTLLPWKLNSLYAEIR